MAESSERELTADEAAYVASARDKAFVLYEGTRTPHRSCGIALAETFSLPTPAYQALRRGGITARGPAERSAPASRCSVSCSEIRARPASSRPSCAPR